MFFEDYREAIPNWRWPHFTPYEMRCRGTGGLVAVPSFLDKMERLREEFNRPLSVTSGYRAPQYNERVSSSGRDGPHTTGRAIDIAIRGAEAFHLLNMADRYEFTGVGVKQSGDFSGRFIHLDDLSATPLRPRPWVWSY